MDKFANNPERKDALQEAANRRDLTETVLEKDFWVCWTLRRITLIPELGTHLTFKGGTSLSKAYGIIERFSEDIDLTISRDAPYVSEGKNPMEDDISRNERERRIEALRQNAQKFVRDLALPALNKEFQKSLGGKDGWQIELDAEDADQQTLLFYYPKVFSYGTEWDSAKWDEAAWNDEGYIRPIIKLEFGARGEPEPHEPRIISPYVAQEFPDLFEVKSVEFSTLSIERTFWEKVTILHSLHHGTNIRDRAARHYYDTFQMAQAGVAEKALANPALLEQVVRNKSLMFRDAKASYDTATLGNLRLVPRAENIESLKKDYAAMQEMFMSDAPSFSDILKSLKQLESILNSKKRS